jgi:hypothetical protein
MKAQFNRFKPYRIEPYGITDLCPLEGDIPVLQFINTFSRRGTAQAKNYLKNYGDFLTWCYETRIINQDEYNILDLEIYCYEHEAAGIFNRVLLVREMLNELIHCLMTDSPVHSIVLEDFNLIMNEANSHLRFEMFEGGLLEVWHKTEEEIAAPLWRIIKWAGLLLQSADVKNIKQCKCGSLFIDKSRNKKRQWCNPLTCGRISRAKRYYGVKIAVNG